MCVILLTLAVYSRLWNVSEEHVHEMDAQIAEDVRVFTLTNTQRPPVEIIGTAIENTEAHIVIDNKRFHKYCLGYSIQCQREALVIILSHVIAQNVKLRQTNRQPKYLLLKEDDFSMCTELRTLFDHITDHNLSGNVIIPAYGLGLLYVPASLLEMLHNFWKFNCTGPPDDCFNHLPKSHSALNPRHFMFPLAVHRRHAKAASVLLHKERCDIKCFVSCHDVGHWRGIYIDNAQQMRAVLNQSHTARKNFDHRLMQRNSAARACNGNTTKFTYTLCHSYT